MKDLLIALNSLKKTNLKSEKVSLNRYDDIESLKESALYDFKEGESHLEEIRTASSNAYNKYTIALDTFSEAYDLAESTRNEFLDLMGEVPVRLKDLMIELQLKIEQSRELIGEAEKAYPKI